LGLIWLVVLLVWVVLSIYQ